MKLRDERYRIILTRFLMKTYHFLELPILYGKLIFRGGVLATTTPIIIIPITITITIVAVIAVNTVLLIQFLIFPSIDQILIFLILDPQLCDRIFDKSNKIAIIDFGFIVDYFIKVTLLMVPVYFNTPFMLLLLLLVLLFPGWG